MPHLVLEYTSNINQEIDFQDLFSRFHQVLSDTGGITINNCKSRAIKLDHFYIGSGTPGQAFLHLDVRFMEGRSDELKQEIGKALLDVMKEVYTEAIDSGDVQVTVEINDISRQFYFKFPEGTLSAIAEPPA